jgi:CxxC motif-containing protein (DUF1111 family)
VTPVVPLKSRNRACKRRDFLADTAAARLGHARERGVHRDDPALIDRSVQPPTWRIAMTRTNRVVPLLFTVAISTFLATLTLSVEGQTVSQAPAAFDNQTNGLVTQAVFNDLLAVFEEREGIDEGLGPVYNAQSCAECHQNPVTGGISQITELRAGHLVNGNFVDAAGGSLINDRAIDAQIQERVGGAETIRTLRASTNVLGAGFIEAISNNTLIAIANAQPGQSGGAIAGQVINVPLSERPGQVRVGRFGWKNQHASLLSFSGDAYLNEMGITSRLNPTENTSVGRSVAAFDDVPDPEDVPDPGEDEADIDLFTTFMRATKAPPRDTALAGTSAAVAGSTLFNQIGCNICHVRDITTSPPGTLINGGAFTVAVALGNKIIHPFSDFLLHNIGTGDGIVQNGGQATANKLRTMPLWGTRTRDRHMHDGLSLTFTDSILRHAGEATIVTNRFRALSATQQSNLIIFLQSL